MKFMSAYKTVILSICIFMVIYGGCNKDLPTESTGPFQITANLAEVTQVTATIKVTVKSNNGEDVVSRGVCWNLQSIPTVDNYTTLDGFGTGDFTSKLTKLRSNSIYYFRGYVTTKSGTYYGNQFTFQTYPSQAAVLTTNPVTDITLNSATSGGVVISDSHEPVLEKGICWSILSSPSSFNADFYGGKTTEGPGTGSFIGKMTGLKKKTTYYVCAYAVSAVGESYGAVYSFKTATIVELPQSNTLGITGITLTSAIGFGLITSNGDGIITEKGVCWSTGSTPTINDNKSVDEDTVNKNSISAYISGLEKNTNYYLRTYVINSAGVGYGSIMIFKTGKINDETVTDIDGNIYHSVTIGSQVWMIENLKTTRFRDGSNITNITDKDKWNTMTVGAYCDYDNNASNSNTYGRLYNWYAVTDSRKIAPQGWRIPTDADWQGLSQYLGGEDIAGGKLKEDGLTHWASPNSSATNETGFTGLPGGRRDTTYFFENINYNGYFWTSTSVNTELAKYWYLSYRKSSLGTSSGSIKTGYSIRCIKEN
jgi:uncharacterized protein (TIGR02145 family)